MLQAVTRYRPRRLALLFFVTIMRNSRFRTPWLSAETTPLSAADNIRFGVCQDRLPDGKYEDLLLLNHAVGISFPWIVVSRTGDWPEYLAAVELGAYDFLAYPPMQGELSRILRTLLETTTATEYKRPLFPTHGCHAPSQTT